MRSSSRTRKKSQQNRIVSKLKSRTSHRRYRAGSRANLNSRDEEGNPRLIRAIDNNDIDTVKYLLRQGDDPNIVNKNGQPALIRAINNINTNIEIVKLLLENGADPDIKQQRGMFTGESPLIRAIEENKIDVVELLINHGANIESTDSDGYTALMIANLRAQYEILTLLINKGAAMNTQNNDGSTALMNAISEHFFENVELLLKNGADLLDLKDNQGYTALMHALTYDEPVVIKYVPRSRLHELKQAYDWARTIGIRNKTIQILGKMRWDSF